MKCVVNARLLSVSVFPPKDKMSGFVVHRFGDNDTFSQFSVVLPVRLDLPDGFQGKLEIDGLVASNQYGVKFEHCVVRKV